MNFIETCRQVISIDSSPQQGNERVAQFMGELCEGLGFCVDYHRVKINGKNQINVIARPSRANDIEDELMLQSHLDTGEPGNFSFWNKTSFNPYNASIEGDSLYGLGASGGKIDFLCKVVAAKKFVTNTFDKAPFVLVGTFGQESGMSGAIKLMRRKIVTAKKALVGGSTGLRLANAGPGIAVVELTIPFSEDEKNYHIKHDLMESSSTQSKMFSLKATEGKEFSLQRNPIVQSLEYINQLPEGIVLMDLEGGESQDAMPQSAVLEVDMVDNINGSIIRKIKTISGALQDLDHSFKSVLDERFDPPYPILNIGKIRTQREYIRLVGVCQMPAKVTEEIYSGWMKSLREACEKVGSTFRIMDYKPPFFTEEETSFSGACKDLLNSIELDKQIIATPLSTEASVFQRLGINCFVFGPGNYTESIGLANESVKISDLKKAIGFYEECIERFCS